MSNPEYRNVIHTKKKKKPNGWIDEINMDLGQ
jgi:hypothetical protein